MRYTNQFKLDKAREKKLLSKFQDLTLPKNAKEYLLNLCDSDKYPPDSDTVLKDFKRATFSVHWQGKDPGFNQLDLKNPGTDSTQPLANNSDNLIYKKTDFSFKGDGDDNSDPEQNNKQVEKFINLLSQDQPQIKEFLRNYAHQGCFLNASQNLIFQYFFNVNDMHLSIDNESRNSKFELQADGTLLFTESFAIKSYMNMDNTQEYRPQDPLQSIANVSATSKIWVENNELKFEAIDTNIEVHDKKLGKNLFDNGLWDRLKDMLNTLFHKLTGTLQPDLAAKAKHKM